MNGFDRHLWPVKPRTSIFVTVILLVGLLLMVGVLKVFIGWPSENSENIVLGGIFLVSLLPIALLLFDTLVQRGGVIEVRGVKLDFTHMRAMGTSDVTVPVNVGVPGEPVSDSATVEILDSLRQAAANEIVVIDLDKGQTWWETRLLVLLAGAVRLGRPKVIVFVGMEGGNSQRFQGWGYTDDLLEYLIQSNPKYRRSLQRARAAGRQWELVEPKTVEDSHTQPTAPDPYPWMGALATGHSWMIFKDNGAKQDLFIEQILASEVGFRIEDQEGAQEITLRRLEELFMPILHRDHIDQSWSAESQIDSFFQNNDGYLALTQRGSYEGMIPRIVVLDEFVRLMIELLLGSWADSTKRSRLVPTRWNHGYSEQR